MKGEKRTRRILATISNFLVFFLLVAVVIACCLTLFTSTLQDTIGHDFTEEEIAAAAKATMLNVILISAGMAVIDYLRRKYTVDEPAKKITEATEKMIAGDFSVRLEPIASVIEQNHFNDIIECINKMAEELSGVETLRADFIANVSHEMKTPLSVIQNYGKLLEEADLSEEGRLEYAHAITEATRRLSDMMSSVLKLSRLENQTIYPTPTTFDLGEQLCECLLQFESTWEGKGIDIETDISEGVLLSADPELLSLVWNNLFSNAFKFTEEGGRVFLTLTADAERATVSIRDTGCGMSAEVGAHIFEKFYQGDTSHATQGNGLGLALVKRVVDILGAEIAVESAVGVGTIFTVTIGRAGHGLEDAR
ncbi:MAG: HAMP domain-containing histidine kinase [Clostridia bacterium]|nr:HAMP domain-containing histidine kinase [Clostridia bacterium]